MILRKPLLKIFPGRDKAAAEAAQARWSTFAARVEVALIAAMGSALALGRAAQAVEAGLVAAGVGGRRLASKCCSAGGGRPTPGRLQAADAHCGRPLDAGAFDESALARLTGQLASDLSFAAICLHALARAGERAQGAIGADAMTFAQERLMEACEFADRASNAVEAAETSVQSIEPELERQLPGSIDGSMETWLTSSTERLEERLGDHAVALLFRAGVQIEELRRRPASRPQNSLGSWNDDTQATISKSSCVSYRAACEKRLEFCDASTIEAEIRSYVGSVSDGSSDRMRMTEAWTA